MERHAQEILIFKDIRNNMQNLLCIQGQVLKYSFSE